MDSILVLGKPNSGKSLLFNRLTGLSHKVANFPGVTVEVNSGKYKNREIIDFPGCYSLNPFTEDERVAVEEIYASFDKKSVGAILCVIDTTRLETSLVLGLQARNLAREKGVPVVFAFNMMDEVMRAGHHIDFELLEGRLGAPVVGISAKTSWGLPALEKKLQEMQEAPADFLPQLEGRLNDGEILKMAKDINKEFGIAANIILKKQNALDKIFLSSIGGGILFFLIMLFLFQAIFTWAAPLMDLTESIVSTTGEFVKSFLPAGIIQDFVNDALFGGIGSFIVFIPQIMILTFIIGLLEDSGYLARSAIICHRPFSFFGLTGKSFIPFLSGHACAIPAIFAARTILSPKKRWLTIVTTPLMACSARLPVYSLLIVAVIPAGNILGGILTYQGLTFFLLYFLGLFMALIVATILSRSVASKQEDAPFIVELPPYRLPSFRPLMLRSLKSGLLFATKAGPVIFSVSVVVWVLGYFPHGEGHLESSWLSSLGRFIDPIFAPLDLDWRYGVAILASFLAREVFVGTLGTLFGIAGADENIAGLASSIQQDGLSLASGVALLVFYAIALQCVSTLAVVKKETGNNRLPIAMFVGYSLLAYFMAIAAYQMVQ